MDKEPDMVAVELVALDGHRMALKKESRIAAIKLMTEHGIDREVMAWRLRMTVVALETYAARARIKITPLKSPAHWTSGYIANRNENYWSQRAQQKREARKQKSTP